MIGDVDMGEIPTADQVARANASYDWLTGGDGALHWLERSPDVARTSVVSWRPPPAAPDVRTTRLATDPVGSRLHAYGAMPYAVRQSDRIAMVNGTTGHIDGEPATADSAHTYGDLAWLGAELLGVREDQNGDELITIAAGTNGVRVLRATDGFLGSPRPGAGRLAWTQWDRSVMPWDSSEVWVAGYRPGGLVGQQVRIAGGPDESAVQPQWDVDGALYFISDRTGWWNLYRWRDGRVEAVAPMDAECAAAPWESGYANYVLLPRHRIGMVVQEGPIHRVVIVESDGELRPVHLPYTSIKPYLAAVGDRLALIGASPTQTQEIALVATDGSDQVEVIRRGASLTGVTAGVSLPELMRVESADGEVTTLFYPPLSRTGQAPLIVRPHPGPTYNSKLRLDWEVQFFTSRGFAVADVDYRGSTGYGRQFRKALDGNWGRFDVVDCRAVAEHLLAAGRAVPEAVFIAGASAGGYTALRAVSEDGPFTLAVARSAIVNPLRWTATAPRFQRPHAAILAHEDAPVNPERVRRPVMLIHGDCDDVAPISEVMELASALDRRNLLVGMLKLDGVGHELSARRVLESALSAELDAYRAALTEAGLSLPV
jgi:dipeptidyl aminopeptidase/acylaminoacyl peptidase